MNLFGIILISFGLMFNRCVSDQVPETGPSLYCTDLNPQNSLDIEQVRNANLKRKKKKMKFNWILFVCLFVCCESGKRKMKLKIK